MVFRQGIEGPKMACSLKAEIFKSIKLLLLFHVPDNFIYPKDADVLPL